MLLYMLYGLLTYTSDNSNCFQTFQSLVHLDALSRGNEIAGPITWLTPTKPGPQSRVLCGTVCFVNS